MCAFIIIAFEHSAAPFPHVKKGMHRKTEPASTGSGFA